MRSKDFVLLDVAKIDILITRLNQIKNLYCKQHKIAISDSDYVIFEAVYDLKFWKTSEVNPFR